MTAGMLWSQSLLLLAGLVRLLPGGLAEAELVTLLAAALLALTADLLSPRVLAFLPLAGFAALSAADPQLWSFLPLMLYLSLSLPVSPWPALVLAFVCALLGQIDPPLALACVIAAALWLKDDGLNRTRLRYYQSVDDSSQRDLRQRQEMTSRQREQEANVKLALAQERNRIARDIHDNVGHILSRGILQLGALVTQSHTPQTREELEELQASLQAGMAAVRHSVHNTKQDTLYLDREVRSLLDGFTFCPVRYQNSTSAELSLNHKYVVMAIIKEALNNIMRHSNATNASISLSEMNKNHLLLIQDNGTSASASSRQGMGLAAMDERVRGLGGTLHITQERGFRLLVTLPKEEQDEDRPRR